MTVPRLLVSLLSLSLLACSNLGSIHGTVVNRLSGKPVEGVRVSLSGTTTTVTTEKDGSYTIPGVAPGPQKVVLQEPNLLLLNELQVTVGERQKMEASELQIAPKPPAIGLFGYDHQHDRLIALTKVKADSTTAAWYVRKEALLSLPSATSPLKLIVCTGEEAGSQNGLSVLPLVEQVAVTTFFGGIPLPPQQQLPARWGATKQGMVTLNAAAIGGGLAEVDATLPAGPYCVYQGVMNQWIVAVDHCSPFRVVEKQDQPWIDNAPLGEGD